MKDRRGAEIDDETLTARFRGFPTETGIVKVMRNDGRGGQTRGERMEWSVEKLFAKLYVKDACFFVEPIGAIGGKTGRVFVGVEVMEMGLKGGERGLVWGEGDETSREGALGVE